MTPVIEHHVLVKVSDEIYLRAISEIESGTNDRAIGPRGEISRYQLKPTIWHHYTQSTRFYDPGQAYYVAKRHLRHLRAALAGANLKETPEAIAMMWHYGEGCRYAVGKTEADYAQRFSNLVGDYLK